MPKKYNLKYVTSGGFTVDFNGRPYTWEKPTDLLDYDWSFDDTPKSSGYGSSVTSVSRKTVTKTIQIAIYCGDSQSVDAHLARLSELFEPDVLSKTPGKFYINDCYVFAYIMGSKKSIYKTDRIAKVQLKLVIESPFWITEDLHRFEPVQTGTATGFMFPLSFPIGFTSQTVRTLINDHYESCLAKITMYGPATNPQITVGSHVYVVTASLNEGDRIEIDQVNRTVIKISSSGEALNFLGNRGKTYSVFERIPAGEMAIVSRNDFVFDILLYKQRSEPVWTDTPPVDDGSEMSVWTGTDSEFAGITPSPGTIYFVG